MKCGQFISYYKAKRFIKKFYKNASSSSFCVCKELSRTSIGNWNFWSKLLVLTLSWRGSLSYRNQSIDLLCKSMDWFLDDNGLRHERVKYVIAKLSKPIQISIAGLLRLHFYSGFLENYKKPGKLVSRSIILLNLLTQSFLL